MGISILEGTMSLGAGIIVRDSDLSLSGVVRDIKKAERSAVDIERNICRYLFL